MVKVDTTTLASIINHCFDHCSDERFSLAEQKAYLAEGKRLRGLLLNLLSAEFDGGTQEVLETNKRLASVNAEVAKSATNMAERAKTLKEVADLVGNLDKLLNVAAKFV